MADDEDVTLPLDGFLGLESPAQHRLNAERGKVIHGHPPGVHALRRPEADHGARPPVGRGHAIERGDLILPFPERHPGNKLDRRLALEGFAQRGETAGVPVGQRLEDDAVDDGEDRGGRADTEREGEDGDRGEAGALPQQPEPVAEVLEDVLEPRQAAPLADLLLDALDMAETPRGRIVRLAGWHAGGEVGLGLKVEVMPHLLGHLAVEGFLAEEGAEFFEELHGVGEARPLSLSRKPHLLAKATAGKAEGAETRNSIPIRKIVSPIPLLRASAIKWMGHFHIFRGEPQVTLSTRLMAAATCSQLAVSIASCFRPAGVSE